MGIENFTNDQGILLLFLFALLMLVGRIFMSVIQTDNDQRNSQENVGNKTPK